MDRAPVTIRTATEGDFAAVDALLARVYPRLLKDDYAPSVRVLVLPRISRAQMHLLTSGTYYVAEGAGGAILGAGGWTRDRADPLKAHVRHVVTDDRALRRGIGSAILAHVFATARAKGITAMVCWSTFTAERFYAAQGFTRLGEVAVPLDPGITFPAVEMTRRL